MRLTWTLVLSLAAPAALATDADEGILSANLRVGETSAVEVGPAIGSVCDDPAVVKAEMTAGTATNNKLVLTGLKVGTTLCRAGSDQLGYKRFVRVTVSAAGDKDKDKTPGSAGTLRTGSSPSDSGATAPVTH